MKNIIFLDVDGVLNCQLFYEKQFGHLSDNGLIHFYRTVKKYLKKLFHQKQMTDLDYYKFQMCPDRMAMLNQLCKDANAVVVLSASMRSGKSVERLNEIFKYCGATFEIIDKTGYTGYERGTEISQWLKKNITPETYGCDYFEFYNYVIIDDDSDMLLNQQHHFFKTDNYSGLTPNTCWEIKHFFTHR